MKPPGDYDDLLVKARSALLDALEVFQKHGSPVIVIGAQAVYLHTGEAPVALAEATKDSDLALDPRFLNSEPLLGQAMQDAGFYPDQHSQQPGAWLNTAGIPVDLMVPEALAGGGGKKARGARIPPHSDRTTRRAKGLEAVIVDNSEMEITALNDTDARRYTTSVAGPAALLIAKLHKIGERETSPTRLIDKDAHDIYRLLVSKETSVFSLTLSTLLEDPLSQETTLEGLEYLERLFVAGPDALGSVMAGRAEEGIGDPTYVSLSVSLLASDLLSEVRSLPHKPALPS